MGKLLAEKKIRLKISEEADMASRKELEGAIKWLRHLEIIGEHIRSASRLSESVYSERLETIGECLWSLREHLQNVSRVSESAKGTRVPTKMRVTVSEVNNVLAC